MRHFLADRFRSVRSSCTGRLCPRGAATATLSLLLLPGLWAAELRTLTLREAVNLALKQNPDLLEARLDEQKAALAVKVARDPFVPKLFAGSGLAYSNGFPLSIEGSAPSIVQARAVASVYNQPLRYQLAQARENSRGAALDTQRRRDDIILRVVELFLQAEQAARSIEAASRQVESAERARQVVEARVREGRELELEARRAALAAARARHQLQVLSAQRDQAEETLAMVLGFPPTDRVRPAGETRLPVEIPESEDAAARQALRDNSEIRRLESALLAKGFEVKANQSARLPRFDLVAQYGVFARFNNFEDFFQRFQRHNGQIGVSIQLPILPGVGASAQAAQADADRARLRLQLQSARHRITLDARNSFRQVKEAETAREVARLDLEVARESTNVLLARMEEGRATLGEVEQARREEDSKWLAFHEAQARWETARFVLLRHTGLLLAALR